MIHFVINSSTYETLHHIPSSYVVAVVHVVKSCQYCGYTVNTDAQRWSLRLTLGLDSDKPRWFNHRYNLTIQYSSQISDRSWHVILHACVLYTAQGYLYLSKELRTLRERASDSCKVFAGYTWEILYIFTDFQVPERLHWGPEFSHNYTIGYIIHVISS